MAKRTRQHPVLGRLHWDDRVDSWEANLDLCPGCPNCFAIVAEAEWADADPAQLFEIGIAFLEWARQFEPHCREKVADDLLDVYNRSWADEDPEEGPLTHTRAEFINAIRPCAISLHHDGSSLWDYECGELFAGHGIWIMLDESRSFIGRAALVG